MDDNERRRKEAFERVKQWSLDNPLDFAAGTVAKIQMDKIKAELTSLATYTVDQDVGGSADAAFESKDTARENPSRTHAADCSHGSANGIRL